MLSDSMGGVPTGFAGVVMTGGLPTSSATCVLWVPGRTVESGFLVSAKYRYKFTRRVSFSRFEVEHGYCVIESS